MPDPRSGPSGDAGFTLVESVTALGVFAIAALALLHAGAENARTLAALRENAVARIVAENQLVLVMADRGVVAAGTSNGEVRTADQDWRWTRSIIPTSDPDFQRVTVSVSRVGEERIAAEVVAFRGAR